MYMLTLYRMYPKLSLAICAQSESVDAIADHGPLTPRWLTREGEFETESYGVV